jgi:hypothetical protein
MDAQELKDAQLDLALQIFNREGGATIAAVAKALHLCQEQIKKFIPELKQKEPSLQKIRGGRRGNSRYIAWLDEPEPTVHVPRAGTKLAKTVKLLSRKKGISLTDLKQEVGRPPLWTLGRRGYRIENIGERGSAVYRISF